MISAFDERIRDISTQNLVIRQPELLHLLSKRLPLRILDHNRDKKLFEDGITIGETVGEAADLDQYRSLDS